MANFKLGEEIRKDGIFNMSRAWDKEKITIFLYLSPIGHFDIADPSSMQDACHHELSKYDLCSPRVSQ